ncbi:hypothetical protein Tco_0601952 [Tanacetum coccineum]
MIETRFMKIYWIYNLCPEQEEYESEVIDWKRVEFEKEYVSEVIDWKRVEFEKEYELEVIDWKRVVFEKICLRLEVQPDNHIEYLMKGLRNLGPLFVVLDAKFFGIIKLHIDVLDENANVMDAYRFKTILIHFGSNAMLEELQRSCNVLYLHKDGYTKNGMVGCTQSRRLEAVGVAKRVIE